MKTFLSEHVILHFAFEEKYVIPQLLAMDAAPARRQVVMGLVDEHGTMRAAVRKLRRRMRNAQASGSARTLARLEQSFHEFLGILQTHAVNEDNMLLALKQSLRHAIPLR
jgi:hemerythrin-like domain-containing protein